MTERESSGRSRRWLIRSAAVVGGAAAADQLPRLTELTDTTSNIRVVAGQEKRFPSESGVLVLGGLTVRDAGRLAKVVTPGLEPLGPVMYGDYAKGDLDVKSMANDLTDLQNRTGMSTLSLYGHSMGTEVAGELVERIGDKFRFDHIFMDCSPTSLDDIDAEAAAKRLAKINPVYDGGLGLTAYANWSVYGNPFKDGAAYPGLAWDQFEAVEGGQRRLTALAAVARRDNSDVTLLTPQDPLRDDVVDAVEAEKNLRGYFPDMRVYRLGGNQGHANPNVNADAYNWSISQAITDSRG